MLSNIAVNTEAYENIGTKYFGIEITDFEYNLFISPNELGVISLDKPNILFTKDEALHVAKRILNSFLNAEFEAYISNSAMHIDDVKDYMGNCVFLNVIKNNKYLPCDIGWIVFFNPMPQSNWEHKCIYVYICSDKVYYDVEHTCPPSMYMNLERTYLK